MVDYTEKDFDIKKLGCFYDQEKTIFRVFAPESENVFLVIGKNEYQMHKNGYTFEIGLKGDLENVKYHYKNDLGLEYRDPFAYYGDNDDSYVLDTNKFNRKIVVPNRLKDIVIYETSVRDFSSDDSYTGKYSKKFLALTEKGLKLHDYYMIGIDYLKNLGVTHIQLMPTLEFDNDNTEYNWGYNPVSYNYVEKDYVYKQDDPYAYINELKEVVNCMHENGLRITLDVVFNHVYRTNDFDLEKMIPGHIFRYKEDGSLAQGTFCGNEIKSEDVFVRAYILEMIERYLILFDIDGVRLDLMGILDYKTINKIVELKKYKSDFIVYGEGWNMGDVLDEESRATYMNAAKMPEVAFFNDYFRDSVINYVCGNEELREDIKKSLSGTSNNLVYQQSINYVECHDNATFYDRLHKYLVDKPTEELVIRAKFALALCIVGRGVPFIHSGQEFLRTKHFVENSYNASDNINKIDWNRRVEYNDICDYAKDLISLRLSHGEFANPNTNVRFEDYYECIVYRLDDLCIVINGCDYDHVYNDTNSYRCIFDSNGKCDYKGNEFKVPSHSLAILKKDI